MRRYLFGIGMAGMLAVLFFFIYFTFSGFRTTGQSYVVAFSDFLFLVESYGREAFDAPASFDDDRFAAVMPRFQRRTHREVRGRALRTVTQWGAAAHPALERAAINTMDPYLLMGVADALAGTAHPRGAAIIGGLLERFIDDRPQFRRDLIDALGETRDPSALPVLIDTYEHYGSEVGDLLEAIAKCGGTDFLLRRLAVARKPEEIRELLWPLAETRDPRAARAIAQQLLHRDEAVRLRAYSSMGQTMGAEAVEPLIEVLRDVTNEYILAVAINHVLARSVNRSSPAAVSYLAEFADHPTLGWQARYALARIGGDEAVAVLTGLVRSVHPRDVMEHFDYLGAAALPLLRHYLADPKASVRRMAIGKTAKLREPFVRSLIEPLLNDPDVGNRRAVRHHLFELDRLDLLWSFAQCFPEKTADTIWRGFRRDMYRGFDAGYRAVLAVFVKLHWLALVVSGGLGFLLILRRVHIFESYRFTLFVIFLLAEGLVGNFFFLGDAMNDPQRAFNLATGINLLLLVGFLFQERERLPRELRGRFGRLGGASLWLIVPPLLFVGTPLIGEGLRYILRDLELFLPYLVAAIGALFLVLEQWALPWRFIPRGARFQRLMGGALAMTLVFLYARPLQLVYANRVADGDTDGVVLVVLMLVPLLWMLLFHLVHIGILRAGLTGRAPEAPSGSPFEVHADGDRVTVRVRRPNHARRVLVQGVAVSATGCVTAAVAAYYGGGAPAMVLAIIAGLAGAALAGLLFEAVVPRLIIQVRGGFLRCAVTCFGVSLGTAEWFHRPIVSGRVKRTLEHRAGTGIPLSQQEQDWFGGLLAASGGASA